MMSDEKQAPKVRQKGGIGVILLLLAVIAALSALIVYLENGSDRTGAPHVPPDVAMTRVMNRVHFYPGMPEGQKHTLMRAFAALLVACPRITESVTMADHFEISYVPHGFPNGWFGKDVHYEVQLIPGPEGLPKIPPALWAESQKSAFGRVPPSFGLVGGKQPGVRVLRPVASWLCGVNESSSLSDLEAASRKNAPYSVLVHYVPFKNFPPDRF